jgi:hypothetical protein
MKIVLARSIAPIVLAAAAFAVAPACAAAADMPSADALRAKIAAAAGPPPAVEIVRDSVSGLAGTETIYRSGDDFREIDVDGPLHTELGRFQAQDWHQNANGQTVLSQADPGVALADTFTTKVVRVDAPVAAFVLSRLDSAGYGTKEYVDPLTNRVVRREIVTATETTVLAYDDFRTVDGYTAAWHWTRRDGHAENDGDYSVQSMMTRPVASSEIGIPNPRRALVEFPAGTAGVELPVHMIGDRFAVQVMIAGRAFAFLLDSGAPGIAIDAGLAKELGYQTLRTESDASNGTRSRRSTIVVPEIRVGDLHMRDVVAQTRTDLAKLANGERVAGTLGFDFIAELRLRLDYERGTVTAFRTSQPLPLADANAMVVDVRLGSQHPLTSATVNGALGERFVIDTGSSGTLSIYEGFARLHPKVLAEKDYGSYGTSRYYTVGNAIEEDRYQLIAVDIGKLHLKHFETLVPKPAQNGPGDLDGLIGSEVLRYFTVWLDYGDSHVVLVPNAYYRSASQ